MVQVKANSIDAKVLRVLLERYPIDIEEVSKELNMPRKTVERAIKAMEQRGWVALEILSDRTFIRMRRFDFTFIGRDDTQRKAVKHKKRGKKRKKVVEKLLHDDHDDMMYA